MISEEYFKLHNPAFDWDYIPSQFNWVSIDADGCIFAHTHKPIKNQYDRAWYFNPMSMDSDMLYIGKHYEYRVDWEEFLFFRKKPSVIKSDEYFDWNNIPDKFDWVTLDYDGYIYAHTFQPVRNTSARRWVMSIHNKDHDLEYIGRHGRELQNWFNLFFKRPKNINKT